MACLHRWRLSLAEVIVERNRCKDNIIYTNDMSLVEFNIVENIQKIL